MGLPLTTGSFESVVSPLAGGPSERSDRRPLLLLTTLLLCLRRPRPRRRSLQRPTPASERRPRRCLVFPWFGLAPPLLPRRCPERALLRPSESPSRIWKLPECFAGLAARPPSSSPHCSAPVAFSSLPDRVRNSMKLLDPEHFKQIHTHMRCIAREKGAVQLGKLLMSI